MVLTLALAALRSSGWVPLPGSTAAGQPPTRCQHRGGVVAWSLHGAWPL